MSASKDRTRPFVDDRDDGRICAVVAHCASSVSAALNFPGIAPGTRLHPPSRHSPPDRSRSRTAGHTGLTPWRLSCIAAAASGIGARDPTKETDALEC